MTKHSTQSARGRSRAPAPPPAPRARRSPPPRPHAGRSRAHPRGAGGDLGAPCAAHPHRAATAVGGGRASRPAACLARNANGAAAVLSVLEVAAARGQVPQQAPKVRAPHRCVRITHPVRAGCALRATSTTTTMPVRTRRRSMTARASVPSPSGAHRYADAAPAYSPH